MSNIIGNAQLGFNNLSDNKINISKLIKEISNNILENKNVIIKENEKDILENNGFEVDFDAIRTILNNIKEQKSLYKTKLLNKQKQEVTEYDKQVLEKLREELDEYFLIYSAKYQSSPLDSAPEKEIPEYFLSVLNKIASDKAYREVVIIFFDVLNVKH